MLTIITPVMNGAPYIRGCLDNVIEQGINNLEHIVADGGSSDETIAIVEEYRKKYPHIRLLKGPDQGQSDAINKATAMAEGEIVGILNVDDRYEAGTLKKIVASFAERPVPSIGVGDCRVYASDSSLMYVNQPRLLGQWAFVLGFPYPVNPVAYFYHRRLHQAVGGYDMEDHYAMDLDFLCAAGKHGEYFRVPGVLGSFHMVEGSKTATDKQSNDDEKRVEEILTRYTKEYPMPLRWVIRPIRLLVRIARKVCGRTSAWTGRRFTMSGCN